MKRMFGVVGAVAATVFVGHSGGTPDLTPPAAPAAGVFTVAAHQPPGSDYDWEHVTGSCGLLRAAFPQQDLNIRQGYSAEALVALVPDPAKTNLQLFFDRTVESLVWGVGDSGYSLECHSLPWPSSEPADPAPKLFGNEELYKQREETNAKYPGVIVFRSKQQATKIMLLFLVGETPTGGVSHDQFENAMKWMPPGEKSVRMVGPTFSGSFHSLVEVMGQFSRSALVRTGSATSAEARRDFQGALKHLNPANDFRALVFDDDFAQTALTRYVREQTGEKGRIAILSEDDTVYGNFASNKEEKTEKNFLPIRFPREIAHLRNAYRSPVGPSGDASSASEPRHLPLKLESGKLGTDAIPSYSQDQTPISNDAVLLNIASTLRREGVRYAGIFATDALDTVFLCRYLHEAVPNVRLVVFSSDLLLLRAEERGSMAGVLAATTYPLFSRNQHWTHEQLKKTSPRRIPFADGYSEGTYNATRSLLEGDEEKLLEYASPVSPHNDRPPLWLAEVGKEAWWPVALLNPTQDVQPDESVFRRRPATPKADEPFHPERPSSLFRVLFLLTLLFCGVHLYMLRFRYLTPWDAGSLRLARLLPVYPENGPGSSPALVLTGLCVPLAALSWLLGMAMLRFWNCPDWMFSVGGGVGCLLSLALVKTATEMCRAHITRPRGRKACRYLMAAYVLFAGAWTFLIWNPRESAGLLFAYRCLFPMSGASPALPLLILWTALLFFAWVHLNRVTSIARSRMKRPRAAEFTLIASLSGKALAELWLRRSVKPGEVFCVVLGWFVFTWPVWSLWTSDHWVYSVLTILMFGSAVAAIAATFLQFQRVWARFRGYLEQLEKHPVREAFSRLPKEFAGPVWKAIPREHALLISARCRDSLTALLSDSATALSMGPTAGELLASIGNKIRQIEKQAAGGGPLNPATYRLLQEDLAAAANCVILWLQPEWNEGSSDSLSLAEQKPRRISPQGKLRLYAEEFLAFRSLVLIRHIMRSLRNLLSFLVIGFVLMVLAMEAYPFQAPRAIGFEAVAIFTLLGVFTARTLAQMDRNPVLSRLSDTNPHELSSEFGWRVVTAGALPLITVLGSQFPTIGNWLSSWLEPAIKALK